MKPLAAILLTIFLLSVTCSAQNAWKDEWIKRDKFDHLLVSTGISMVSLTFYQDIKVRNPELAAFTTVLVLGGVKEFLMDDYPSAYDFATNCLGAYIGIQLTKWVQKWENKKFYNRVKWEKLQTN